MRIDKSMNETPFTFKQNEDRGLLSAKASEGKTFKAINTKLTYRPQLLQPKLSTKHAETKRCFGWNNKPIRKTTNITTQAISLKALSHR